MKHNRKMPTRPLVRIVYDEDMKRLSKEIDLSLDTSLFIVDSCEV